jgi:hypothetical protein
MKKMFVGLVALAAPAALLVGMSSAAQAVQHDWTGHLGAANNVQEIHYDREDGGNIRLVNKRDNGSPLYCIDVRVDWDTDGGHYDPRILRNCAQNATVVTDPTAPPNNGNGWWEEGWHDWDDAGGIETYYRGDIDWRNPAYGRNIQGMGEAGVFVIDDGSLKVQQELLWQGSSRITPIRRSNAATQNSGNTRVRTLYQDGSLDSTDPYCVANQQAAQDNRNSCDTSCGAGCFPVTPRLATNEELQAGYVRIAWENNGPYSECMAARGYNVPWQDSIGLAPALQDDPELVAAYEERQENMILERRVVPGPEFANAVGVCRDQNVPGVSDPELQAFKFSAPTAKTLRIARKHGWNLTDPFAARGN